MYGWEIQQFHSWSAENAIIEDIFGQASRQERTQAEEWVATRFRAAAIARFGLSHPTFRARIPVSPASRKSERELP